MGCFVWLFQPAFFFLRFLKKIYCVWVFCLRSLYTMSLQYLQKPEGGIRFPGSAVRDGYQLPHGC